MQRDVKVGLVLGVLLVAVVAVVFFRRDEDDRDRFSKLLPAPDAVADRARDLLGPSPTDPYPVAPEYLADSWQSPRPAKSARTPTPSRSKTAKAVGPNDGTEAKGHKDPSRTSAVLLPPKSSVVGAPTRSRLDSGAPASKSPGMEVAIRNGASTEYMIREGDTLSGIASQFLGSASLWALIHEANHDIILDPDHIPVGQRIRIPSGQNDGRAVAKPVAATARRSEPARLREQDRQPHSESYLVREGDTLCDIARRRYGSAARYLDILYANQHQLTTGLDLRAGMVLHLPHEHHE